MSSEKQIFPNKRDMKKLSSRALGLLTTMLNIPENDYLTATELYAISKVDKPADTDAAITELLDKRYIIMVYDRYAVRKQVIVQMNLK